MNTAPDPAAEFAASARRFLDAAAALYLRDGAQLVAAAELIPRAGARTQLFALQVDAGAAEGAAA